MVPVRVCQKDLGDFAGTDAIGPLDLQLWRVERENRVSDARASGLDSENCVTLVGASYKHKQDENPHRVQ